MSDVFPDGPGFFASYRAAFERYDAAAVADHFAFPIHVDSQGGGGAITIDGREAWIAQVERLFAMYRAIGVATARVLDLRVTEPSPGAPRAAVRWALDDSAGRRLYEFDAAYTLVTAGGGPRIAAIAHDEVPRYRECVARLRSGDPEGR